jgi:Holliday junction resolvase
VDTHVDRLMAFVGIRLASCLSKKSFAAVRDPPRGRLPANKFVVVARKITKIVFDMDYGHDERIYVLDVVMSKIVGEITQRCPRVQYKKKRNALQ